MKSLFTITVVFISFLFSIFTVNAQTVEKIYLFPGQGGDQRLFDNLDLSPYETKIINYSDTIPHKNESLAAYASRIAQEIDTTENFALLGVSFGGMIAVEIAELLAVEQVFLVSSAKNTTELAGKFNFLRKVKIHRIIPGRVSLAMSHVVRPLFEPSIKKNPVLFKNMIKGKHPQYLKRAIQMLIEWERIDNDAAHDMQIVHIHGTKDNAIPIKKVQNPIEIEEGSHMMVVFRANEIGGIVLECLNEK